MYDAPAAIAERKPTGTPLNKHTSVISHFDSLDAFLAHLKAREHLFERQELLARKIGPSHITSEYVIKQLRTGRKPVFNMCDSFADAMRLAEYGWPEGRERVAQREAEIRNLMRDMVEAPSFFHDIIGQEVDVPEFLMGTPEHMIGYDIHQTRHKFLRITVDVNCRCDACGRRAHDLEPNPPEWAMVRGAVVALLVQALTRYGFQVEVTVGAVCTHREQWRVHSQPYGKTVRLPDGLVKHTTSVTIHRPGWLFDFDRLVFCTAHEGFPRKLLFRHEEGWLIEQLDGYPREMDHDSMPHVAGVLHRLQAHKPEYMPEMGESDIHIDSFPVMANRLTRGYGEDAELAGRYAAGSAFATVQAGAKWLLERMKEMGIVFK